MSLPLDKNFIPNKVAAELSGYNSDYIARLCREGKIEGTQIGRAWFINRDSLEKFVRQQEERKREISRELSRAREVEYKARTQETISEINVKQTTPKKVNVVLPVAGPRLSDIHPYLQTGFALSLTVLVLFGSVVAAESGIVNRIGARLIAAAIEAHEGETTIPDRTAYAVYSLGSIIGNGTANLVTSTPRTYHESLLALVSTPRDVSAAVATAPVATDRGIGDDLALFTYHTITGFFSGLSERIAILLGFETSRLTIIPFDAAGSIHPSTSLPVPHLSENGTATYAPRTESITNVTYLTGASVAYVNSYVSAYVNQALLGLSARIGAEVLDGRTVNHSTTVISSGGSANSMDGGTITNSTITNSTFTGGAIVADSLTVNGPTTLTGTTTISGPLVIGGLNGVTECLHVDASGIVSGTGSDCGVGGGGITGLKGQYSSAQTGATQTFATSSDPNIQLTITSSGNTHTFTPIWTGILSVARGGLGLSSVAANQLLIGNSAGTGYASVATSSLGLSTSDISEGANLYYTLSRFASALAGTTTDALAEGVLNRYYTDTRARNAFTATATGLSYSTTTGVLSLSSGYEIPLSASTSNWNSFYTTPSSRITAGTNLSWAGNTLNGPSDAYIRGLFSAGSPLSYDNTTGAFSIAQASASANGYLSSSDWTTFNNKFATSSVDFWKSQRDFFATSSASYFLSQNQENAFSTSSALYFISQNRDVAFSTSSSNYWLTTKSTTNLAEGSNLYYRDDRVNDFINGSSTIPKTYSTNVFTGGNTFAFATITNATSSNMYVSGTFTGAGLASCSTASDKLLWDSATGRFTCGADAGAGGGITALQAQYSSAQTGSTQTFATSSDINLGLTITSAGNTHTFTPVWIGTLGIARGGTGIASTPSYGQLLLGNGSGYTLTATSSLGLESPLTFASPLSRTGNAVTIQVASGSQNGYLSSADWTSFSNKISSTSLSATYPLAYNSGTGVFTLAFGTTTSNTWAGTQTFTNNPILGTLTGLIYGNNGTLATAATGTVSNGSGISVTGGQSVIGSGLTITNTGVLSLAQSFGSAQTGALTLASSTVTANGQTHGIAITNSTGTFTFTPTISGTLSVAGGGTGLTTVADGSLLFGSGSTAFNALASSTGGFLTNSYTTGRPTWSATSTLNIALADTTGTLGIARGGTGATTFISGQLVYGNGTNALTSVATSSVTNGSGISLSGSVAVVGAGGLTITNTGVIAVGPTGQTTNGTALFATSTTGTDFTITGAGSTITFNLPTASGSVRGLLSSADWTTFNSKQGALTFTYPLVNSGNTVTLAFGTTTSNTWAGTQTFTNASTSNLSAYTAAFGATATSSFSGAGALTLAGLTNSLLYTNGSNVVSAVTVSSPLTFSAGTLAIQVANGSQNGYLTSADWTSFSNKVSSSSLSATYPLAYNSSTGVFSELWGTTTANSWSALQQFNGNASTSQLTTTGNTYLATVSGNVGIGTTAPSTILDVTGTVTIRDSSNRNTTFTTDVNGLSITTSLGNTYINTGDLYANRFVDRGNTAYLLDPANSGTSIIVAGNIGAGTTTPAQRLSVQGNGLFSGNLSSANLTATGTITFSGLGTGFVKATGGVLSIDTNTYLTAALTSLNGQTGATQTFATTSSNGGWGFSSASNIHTLNIPTASASNALGLLSNADWTSFNSKVSSSSLLAAYPFPLSGNATSTLTQFNGGLTAYASSTIGDGTQTGGLTISGGATTTGNQYVGGTITATTFNANGASNNILTTGGQVAFLADVSGNNVAGGFFNTSSGGNNQAFGLNNNAIGSFSSAYGFSNTASGYLSSAFGSQNNVSNNTSLAFGASNVVTGVQASAFGYAITNSVDNSTMIGPSNTSKLTILSTQRAGFGTTSPFADFSIHANNGDTNTTLFAIGSSTASATSTLFSIDNTGTVTIGSLTGPLQAVNGAVSATSTLSTVYGGTGISTAPTYGQLLVGNSSGTYTLTATSSLGFQAAGSYESPLTFTYPITRSSNTISLAFGTTTANSWSALQTFNGGASTTQISAATGFFNSILATSSTATSTFAGGLAVGGSSLVVLQNGKVGVGTAAPGTTLDISGTARVSSALTLSSILSCTGAQALQTNGSGDISCGSIATGGASSGGGWTTNNIGVISLSTTTDRVVVGASTTPYAKLSVLSGSSATTTLALLPASGQTANILDVYNANGAVQSVISAAGYFGIGTTGPSTSLSVQGNGLFSGDLAVANLTATGTITFSGLGTGFVKATGGVLSIDTNTYLTAALTSLNGQTGATQTFATTSSNGGWGFSSASNIHTLNIPTASASNALGLLSNADWTSFNSKVSSSSLSAIYPLAYNSSTGVFSELWGTTTANSFSQLQQFNGNATATQLTTTGNAYLATAGGSVGIGSSSPTTLLSVGGNASFGTAGGRTIILNSTTGLITGSENGESGPRFVLSNNINSVGGGGISFSASGGSGGAIASVANNTISLYAGAATGGNEKVRITATGLGIGTTSPGSLLSINGIANFTAATTTFYGTGGINLAAGCYAINGTCLSLSSFNGTLSVANGGTGSTTLTGILVGNGTSAVNTLTVSSPLTFSGSTLAIQVANGSQNGYLTSADWTSFSNKISSTSLSATYPLAYNSGTGVFTLAFGTTTSNTWAGTQTFTNTPVLGTLTGLVGANNGTLYQIATSTSFVTSLTGTANQITVSGNTGAVTLSIPSQFNIQNASTTNLSANTLAIGGTATTSISAAGTLTLAGGFNGPLQANNGVVSASSTLSTFYGGTGISTAPLYGQILVGNSANGYTLTSTSSLGLGSVTSVQASGGSTGLSFSGGPITSSGTLTLAGTLNVANGGTGWTSIQAGTLLYGNGTGALATTTAGTNGQTLALVGGIPTWVATTTFSSGLSYLNGNVTNTGVLALGPTGQTTTGTALFATSTTGTDFTITGAGNTITFNLPSASAGNRGVLTSADWTSFSNKISSTSLSATYPLAYNSSTGVFTTAFSTTTTNTYSGLNTFNGGVTIGSLTGPLQAVNGVVSASSTLSTFYGGTGISTAPTYGQLLVGNAGGTYTLTATSSLGLQSALSFTYPLQNTTNVISLAFGTTTSNTWAGTQSFSTASTTNLTISGIASDKILYTAGNGVVSAAGIVSPLSFSGVGGLSIQVANGSQNGYLSSTDWTSFSNKISSTSLSATYPVQYNSGTGIFSLAFGTTTANSWSQLQQFNGGASSTQLTTTGTTYLATAGGSVGVGTTSPTATLEVNGTVRATSYGSAVNAANISFASGFITMTTSGLANVVWNGTSFSAGSDATRDLGATSNRWRDMYLSGNIFVGSATGNKFVVNSAGNVGISTTSPFALLSVGGNAYIGGDLTATGTVTIASLTGPLQAVNGVVSASSTLSTFYGGTGISTAPTYGQLLVGNAGGTYTLTATSSLGVGSVTSVNASGGTTGLSFSGGPVTSSGTLTLAGTLAIANGGTNAVSQVTNGVTFFDGSKITTSGTFTYSSTTGQLSIPSNGWLASNSNLFGYASSTNGATIFGLSAGGNNATTSATVLGTTAIGYQALTGLTTGTGNTALGYQTLTLATTTAGNTALGYQALKGSSDGNTFSSGGANTAIGYQALTSLTTGNQNTAIGYQALQNATSTSNNLALGYQALLGSATNFTGNSNTALGNQALRSVTTGSSNVAIGNQALTAVTIGANNVGIGSSNTGSHITTGSQNIAIGNATLTLNTTGSDNVAVGYNVLNFNVSPTSTVAIGENAGAGAGLYSNKGSLYLGFSAGNQAGNNSDYNTFLGYQAGYNVTTGYGNLILGASPSTGGLSTGANNIGIGYNTFFPSNTANNQLNIGGLVFGSLPATTTAFALPTSGSIGIGTSSPYAKLSIHSNSGDLATTLFAIGSSTASATTTLFSISNTGVITSVASATSTFTNGIALTGGCFSLNGTCIGSGSFTNTLANGGTATTTFYNGGVVFSDGSMLTQSSATSNFFWDETNKRLGLGTSTPFGQLSINPNGITGPSFVIGSSTKTSFLVSNAGKVAIGLSALQGTGSNLQIADPSSTGAQLSLLRDQAAIGASDGIGRIVFGGTDSGVTSAAAISAFAAENFTGSVNGAYLTFGTTPIGGNSLVEAMRIDTNGYVGIGTTSPTGQLSINPNGIAGPAFIIGSTTKTLFSIANNGILSSSLTGTSTLFKLEGNTFIIASTSKADLAVGTQSLRSLVNGLNNVAFGDLALLYATSTSNNTAIGAGALMGNSFDSSGGSNTAVGVSALSSITSGSSNVGLGAGALGNIQSGSRNIGIGSSVGSSGSSASDNVDIGANAQNDGGGSRNVVIGSLAGRATLINESVLIGYTSAGTSFTGTLFGNTLVGAGTGAAFNGTSPFNTFLGYQAGYSVTSGYGNILLGASSTSNLTTGSNNIMIGNNTFAPAANTNNSLNIGGLVFGSLPATTTAFALPTSGSIGIGTSSPYAKLSIHSNSGDLATTLFAIGSSTASATTTLFSISNTGAITQNGGATSTFSNGINLASGGCFAVNGTCVGSGSFTNTLANGGTATTTFYNGGVVFSDGNKLTQSSAAANFFWDETNARLGLGTSTPFGQLSINPNGISGPAFVIGSSTKTLFSVANNGIISVNLTGTSTVLKIDGENYFIASTSRATTGLGYRALNSWAKGTNNVAFGDYALLNATSTSGNTALGVSALAGSTFDSSGQLNTAVGVSALNILSSGSFNTVVGAAAFTNTLSGSRNVGIGYGSGATSGASGSASDNVSIGYDAQNDGGGSRSVVIGSGAGKAGAVTESVVIGYASVPFTNGTLFGNTLIGAGTGSSFTITSPFNTFLGYQAGYGITTGYGNLLLGASSTSNLTTGSNNIMIGNNTYATSSTASNSLNIGGLVFGSLPATTTAFALPTSGSIGIGTSSPYAKLSIHSNSGDLATTLFAVGSSTASATTTLFSISNTGVITSAASATSTFTNGIALTGGCFSLNGNCVGSGSFTNNISSGGTGTTTFYAGGVVYSDGVTLTQASNSGNSVFKWDNTNGRLGLGTTTPGSLLSLGSLANFTTATSTFYSTGGINLTGGGCFAINGTCVGAGSFTNTLANGGTATTTFYSGGVVFSDGVTLTQASSTSDFFWDSTNKRLGLGTSSPSAMLSINPANGATTPSFIIGSTTGTSFVVTGAGLVGIGTSSPSFTLDTVGSFRVTSTSTIPQFQVNTLNGQTLIAGNAGASFTRITSEVGFSSTYLELGTNPSGNLYGYIRTRSARDLNLGTAATNYLTFDSANLNNIYTPNTNSRLSLGTTTGPSTLTIGSSTAPQLTLSDNSSTNAAFSFRSTNGSLFIATSSASTYATSSISALTISTNGYLGIATNTPGSLLSIQGVANFTTATTTFSSTGGINLANGGCFAINGVCLTGGGTTYTFSYPLINTANTISLGFGTTTANSWSALQQFNGNASTTQLSISGNTYFPGSGIWNSSGFVGIGTTSPNWLLSIQGTSGVHIKTTTDIASALTLENSTGSSVLDISTLNNASSIFSVATSTGNTYFYVGASGAIGIGTTSPFAKLSLNANNGETNTTLFAIGSSTASATTTLFSISNTGVITSAASATSTFTNGIALTGGCFSLNGSCVGAGSFTNNLLSGGTATTTFYNGGVVFSDGSKLTQASNSGNNVLFWDNTNGNLGVGSSSPTSKLSIDTGVTTSVTPLDIVGSINDFFQVNIQNRSTGSGAQSGYAATADNGTPTSGFAWMGINNSGFNNPQTYNVGGPGDVTFLGSGNDLYLANNNATKSIYFLTGGTATSTNTRMAITATGDVGIGSSTPTAGLTVINNGTSATNATLYIATTSTVSAGQSPILVAYATTTGDLNYSRVGIGTTSPWGDAGLRDQLTVDGRIYSTWRYASCDFIGGSLVAAIVADTLNACGQFTFDILTTGSLTNTAGYPPYAILRAAGNGTTGAAATGSGSIYGLSTTVGSASSSPIMEAWVRTSRVAAATTTPYFLVGMTNTAFGAAPTTLPTNGVYFMATSTNTWRAIVRKGGVDVYNANTGIATTTGTGSFQKMRIEVASSSAIFLINGTIVSQAGVATGVTLPSAWLRPMITVAALAPSSGATDLGPRMDISLIRFWLDDPASPLEGDNSVSGDASSPPALLPLDRISGAEISEAYLADTASSYVPGMIVIGETATSSLSEVRVSGKRYDTPIMGVVSTAPRMVLGQETGDTIRVAQSGRVPVLVSLENGPVHKGDTITTSSIRGVGMKSTRIGSGIGHALDNFDPENHMGVCDDVAKQELADTGVAVDDTTCIVRIMVGIDTGFSFSVGNFFQDAVATLDDISAAMNELSVNVFDKGVAYTKLVIQQVVAKIAVVEKLYAAVITVLPGGDVVLPAGQNQVSGDGTLVHDTTSVFIANTKTKEGSKVFITPRGLTESPLAVTEIKPGEGFRVATLHAPSEDVAFDWLMITTYATSTSSTGTSTAPTGSSAGGDTTPPEVLLNGASPLYVPVGGSYVEPGATASDAVDGPVSYTVQVDGQTVDIASGLDTSVPRTYTLTYVAVDAAGNFGNTSRTVIVANPGESAPPSSDSTPVPNPVSAPADTPVVTAPPDTSTSGSDASPTP